MPEIVSVLIKVALAFLVLNHFFTPCTALGSSGGRVGFSAGKSGGGKSYKEQVQGKAPLGSSIIDSSLTPPREKTARRGIGLSAWGIITIILTIIFAGTGFYYFTKCYPILCKKQRKYDIIPISHV